MKLVACETTGCIGSVIGTWTTKSGKEFYLCALCFNLVNSATLYDGFKCFTGEGIIMEEKEITAKFIEETMSLAKTVYGKLRDVSQATGNDLLRIKSQRAAESVLNSFPDLAEIHGQLIVEELI